MFKKFNRWLDWVSAIRPYHNNMDCEVCGHKDGDLRRPHPRIDGGSTPFFCKTCWFNTYDPDYYYGTN